MSENLMPAALDYAAIGNLVKGWILDRDLLKKPDPANPSQNLCFPRPVSSTDPAAIEALRQQFLAAGTGYVIPETVTELVVVQSTATRFVLKLPDAEAVRASENRLEETAWVIPDFYDTALGQEGVPSLEEKLTLDAQRIGDYMIANCAG